jgi:hypothetical protein
MFSRAAGRRQISDTDRRYRHADLSHEAAVGALLAGSNSRKPFA